MARILNEVSQRTSGEGQCPDFELIPYHADQAGYTAEQFEESDEGMTKLRDEIADLAIRITSLVENVNPGEETFKEVVIVILNS
jgi:hypothetical protein